MSETHAPAPAHDAHGHDNHGPLQHQFEDLPQQRESYALGMWLFLCTELMMFGGLFFAYSLYRGMYPGAYHYGSGHLNITLGTANTFVLLFSSFTMAMAVRSAQLKSRGNSALYLTITWLLGAAFIGIKAIEWTHDFHIGLVPSLAWFWFDVHPAEAARLAAEGIGANQVMMYFVIYFCMTGLHAIHMLIGLGLVGYFIYLTLKGHFLGGNDQPVEILGLYWHLVDIIWIFLFPLLYLIAGFHPFAQGGGH